eukprot:scaffold1803_cov99-Cylindrotheca_fusiformis.AAC.2
MGSSYSLLVISTTNYRKPAPCTWAGKSRMLPFEIPARFRASFRFWTVALLFGQDVNGCRVRPHPIRILRVQPA